VKVDPSDPANRSTDPLASSSHSYGEPFVAKGAADICDLRHLVCVATPPSHMNGRRSDGGSV
jgi:hypothetical protein